jgi:hypothetical protein
MIVSSTFLAPKGRVTLSVGESLVSPSDAVDTSLSQMLPSLAQAPRLPAGTPRGSGLSVAPPIG